MKKIVGLFKKKSSNPIVIECQTEPEAKPEPKSESKSEPKSKSTTTCEKTEIKNKTKTKNKTKSKTKTKTKTESESETESEKTESNNCKAICDYLNEVSKFVNTNDPEKVDIYLVLNFLLDNTNNPAMNEKYINFCKRSLVIENVRFIYACKELSCLTKYIEIVNRCVHIYYEFIDDRCKTQINLDAEIKIKIKTILKMDDKSPRQTQKKMLNESFSRLYSKSSKKKMIAVFELASNHITTMLANNTVIPFIKEYLIFDLDSVLIEGASRRSKRSTRSEPCDISNIMTEQELDSIMTREVKSLNDLDVF